MGTRIFSHKAPFLWNQLQAWIRGRDSLFTFKGTFRFQTFLFENDYYLIWIRWSWAIPATGPGYWGSSLFSFSLPVCSYATTVSNLNNSLSLSLFLLLIGLFLLTFKTCHYRWLPLPKPGSVGALYHHQELSNREFLHLSLTQYYLTYIRETDLNAT